MSRPTNKISNPTKFGRFWLYIKNGPIQVVSLIPMAIAALLIVLWIVIKEKFFLSAPQSYNYVVLSVAAISMGFVGLIYIYRKEMPGPVYSTTVKGGCAVISGLALILFFWVLGIAEFVFALLE
jgi:hypothetical protein